ncbi:hypothetical protein SETIT_9G071100v2 [Setaria italica]|uniref:Uncharacterized protein n=2 Tax=Setaria TaxID=4554 RepID=A0A368SDV8_SETIT|nr:hypothetical protein SETIT_9G071100v2 [Setaria italica]TKV91054.1 hypothetical protein SEVIR_9G070200v2 [Setaria viridis]
MLSSTPWAARRPRRRLPLSLLAGRPPAHGGAARPAAVAQRCPAGDKRRGPSRSRRRMRRGPAGGSGAARSRGGEQRGRRLIGGGGVTNDRQRRHTAPTSSRAGTCRGHGRGTPLRFI